MKYPIKWHKETLKNHKEYIAHKRDEMERIRFIVDAEMDRMLFHEKQIQEAEKRGLKEFDATKLLVRKQV